MVEIGLPQKWAAEYSRWHRYLQISGGRIDREFIDRGFVTVQALIDRQESLAGTGTYAQFLRIRANPSEYEKYRRRADEARRRLSVLEASVGEVPSHEWDGIMSDHSLAGTSKLYLLARFFPHRFDEYSSASESRLEQAAKEEAGRVCSLFADDPRLLFDKATIPLRKVVSNAVMRDAYGRLGLKRRCRRQGIDSYYKPISGEYATIVELDNRLLNQPLAGSETRRSRLTLDRQTYLGSSRKVDKRRWFTFLPVDNCLASLLGRAYRDTSSLEVALRASALWHELAVAPFETVMEQTSAA